jgi:hypothetical protein
MNASTDRLPRGSRGRLRSFLIGMSVASASGLAAAPAIGQPKPETAPATTPDSPPVASPAMSPAVAEARAAFQEGIVLARAERWALALQALEHSEALHPHAVTTYNIGYCELQLGHLTRARKSLAKSLTDHRAGGEVELPSDLVSAAQRYVSELDQQIARVRVTITPGAALAVDGHPLELGESSGPYPVLLAGTRGVGQAEVPPSFTFEVLVDPGAHVFALSVKGGPDVIANETLAPGSQISLELRVPEATASPRAPSPPSQGAAPPAKKPNRVPAFIALGIGATGLAVGTVGGLLAFGKKSDVERACSHGPDASDCTSLRGSGNRAADISTGAFIGGGAALAVGAVLFLTTPGNKTSKRAGTAAQARPVLGWGALGLEGRF